MDTDSLLLQTKRNCAISDAGYWGYYSICGLLLRLRELCLSEHGLAPWEPVRTEVMAAWISEREALWERLCHEQVQPIELNGSSFSPFDAESINQAVSGLGLYYGSGVGLLGKPVFFVADLISTEERLARRVTVCGRELCRDLSLFPALLQGRAIIIRREALASLFWEKIQTMRSRPKLLPQDDALLRYGIPAAGQLHGDMGAIISAIIDDTIEIFVLHELGEAHESDGRWPLVLANCTDKGCDLYVRGVKDILADTSEQGPLKAIIGSRDTLLLSFYLLLLDGLRKELFPEIVVAYHRHRSSEAWPLIDEARRQGYARAAGMRDEIIRMTEQHTPPQEILAMIRRKPDRPFDRQSS